MEVCVFASDDCERWDAFCAESSCLSFLPTRRYLSYHTERFQDASLVVAEGDRWLGVFPAASDPSDPTVVVSHPGITFAGMVHGGRLVGDRMLEALERVRDHYLAAGFERLRYKVVPYLYQRFPAQDDVYALTRLGGHRYRCDLSCTIDLDRRGRISERRRRGLKKAQASGVAVVRGHEHCGPLWEVLTDNLARRHDAAPTHDLTEMQALIRRFPEGIRVHAAQRDGAIEAGVVVYANPGVHHLQYVASSPAGNAVSALDAVIEDAIESARSDGARWFDFGISTEADGTRLNGGLYQFKHEFGGGGVVHEFYELGTRT